eukprot:7941586-Pyramimonas_sp.AAC.1
MGRRSNHAPRQKQKQRATGTGAGRNTGTRTVPARRPRASRRGGPPRGSLALCAETMRHLVDFRYSATDQAADVYGIRMRGSAQRADPLHA